MGSSRLPGKVMKPVMGRPLLGHLLDRLRLCLTIDEIIVATATAKENDVIEEFCVKENIVCYRGSENDVLDRTLSALVAASATIGVEVYGDCPLIDPQIVDEIVGYFIRNPGYDFVSNDLKTTYPPGMEVEVSRVAALADSSKKLEPHRIPVYLYDLSSEFHSYWNMGKEKEELRFISKDKKLSDEKLVFLKSISTVIKTGMSIVGVDTPEKM